MDREKILRHVKRLCRRNLKSDRVKCCAECPFEEEIVEADPSTRELFDGKRRRIK